MSDVIEMSWYIQESPGLNPDCNVEMSLLWSKKAYTWSKIIFSRIFPQRGRSEIGR